MAYCFRPDFWVFNDGYSSIPGGHARGYVIKKKKKDRSYSNVTERMTDETQM